MGELPLVDKKAERLAKALRMDSRVIQGLLAKHECFWCCQEEVDPDPCQEEEPILHIAAQEGLEEVVETLLPSYPPEWYNHHGSYGMTILHCAIEGRNLRILELLLDSPLCSAEILASPMPKSDSCFEKGGRTALHLAVMKLDCPKMVELILNHKYFDKDAYNTCDGNYRTPLHYAVRFENEAATRMLLNSPLCSKECYYARDAWNHDVLSYVATSRNTNLQRLVHDSPYNFTPMVTEQAVWDERGGIYKAIANENIDDLKAYLQYSPIINKRLDAAGSTALHVACQYNACTSLKVLLDSPRFDASIFKLSQHCTKDTVLHHGAHSVELIRILLSSEYCDETALSQTDMHGKNVLEFAALLPGIPPQVACEIIKSPHCTGKVLDSPYYGEQLFTRLINLNPKRYMEAIKLILDSPHSSLAVLGVGTHRSPLLAVLKTTHYREMIELVQAILSSRHCCTELLEIADAKGYTALHCAYYLNSPKIRYTHPLRDTVIIIINLLIAAGARTDVRDIYGRTPAELGNL